MRGRENMAIVHGAEGDGHQITLEGVVDVGTAAELKEALLEALRSGPGAVVSLEAVSDMDVTAYQLLWAAQREAERSGRSLICSGPLQGPVAQALADLGLRELVVAQTAEEGSRA